MYTRVLRVALSGTVCLLLAGLADAASLSSVEDVTKNRAVYTQKLQEYAQEHDAAKADILARYRKALDALRQDAKQKGDLDAVQAVDEEIARFEKQKGLPLAAPPSASPDAGKAVRFCRDALDAAELESAGKVIDLTDRYLEFLDKGKKQAVREDKLDLARAIDSESKTVWDTPEYQAAKFEVAEKSTAEPPKAEAVEPSEPKPAVAATTNVPPPVLAPTRVGPNGERIQPRVDPDGLYDAAHIFEGIPPGVIGSPTSYKQLTAVETGKAPLAGGVGISLEGGLDGENAKYQLRFRLRAKTAGATAANLKVLAHYFVKNQAGGAIQETRLQFALIPSLGAKSIICEMKPMDLPYAYTYHYRGGNFVEEREGAFVGVVVDVFSPEDKLIGQVASANVLKDRGKTAFELPNAWMEHSSEVPPEVQARPNRRQPQPMDNN